jgi:hypothetical protein
MEFGGNLQPAGFCIKSKRLNYPHALAKISCDANIGLTKSKSQGVSRASSPFVFLSLEFASFSKCFFFVLQISHSIHFLVSFTYETTG